MFVTNLRSSFSIAGRLITKNSHCISNIARYSRLFSTNDTETIKKVIIPEDKLDFTFYRSGGPGGQNVNKVNTKVVLKLDVEKANWIPQDIKERFMVDHANRINGDGILVITSSLTRFQQLNREDVIHKLQEMLDYSSVPPKVRVINTEPTEESKLKWKKDKIHRSEIKKNRKKSGMYEFF